MCATPSVLKRYESAMLAFATTFLAAAAFSCPLLVPPRRPITAHKSSRAPAPITTPRRTIECMKAFLPFVQSIATACEIQPASTRALKFSRLPHPRSTYFIASIAALPFSVASPLTCVLWTHTLTLPLMTASLPFPNIAKITTSIRSKKISPVELVESHLRRIESLQPKLNAFVHLDAAGARAQARTGEAAVVQNQPLGPLHGVPLTLKSCIDVAGWTCPAGSLLRKDYVPRADAPLVSRLKSAGAIL
ncbi:MAG: hypothetical protein DMG36_10665, partial [Acidobacteria bacterium]